jgi:hypothetical protein
MNIPQLRDLYPAPENRGKMLKLIKPAVSREGSTGMKT